MDKVNFNLGFWQHTSPDCQVYQKLTKSEKKVFKEICSTRGRSFIDKSILNNDKKYLEFLMQMLCLGNTYLNSGLKPEYSCYRLTPARIVSTMIGLDDAHIRIDGSIQWHAPQGKRQSYNYRLNRFNENIDYFYYRLAGGELDIPLIWSLTSPVLSAEHKHGSNHRSSLNIRIKMIGRNRQEVQQLWETMVQKPLGIRNTHWPTLIGPLEYYSQSNATNISDTINSYARLIENAKEECAYLELASKQAQQNIAVINSTVIMANSTYVQ